MTFSLVGIVMSIKVRLVLNKDQLFIILTGEYTAVGSIQYAIKFLSELQFK